MSYEAIRWALAQAVSKSSAKFVLVAMADCVNGEQAEMLCWPSAQHLISTTGQDRKTILDSLRRLKELGYIEDTKQRRGATGQVVVYRLQTPDAEVVRVTPSHYVYRLSEAETGNFYIGVRTCLGLPEHDTGYRGSGNWCQLKRLNGEKLDKEILSVHESRPDADRAEQSAIRELIGDPLCRNIFVRPNRPEIGLVQRSPDFPDKEPEFPTEVTRFPALTVPNSGHGTRNEPVIGTSKEQGDPRLAGIPPNFLSDYLEVRKAKKAGKFTTTAISGMEREANKAGLSLSEAVQVCAELGWQGFNAGWYEQRMTKQRPNRQADTIDALTGGLASVKETRHALTIAR